MKKAQGMSMNVIIIAALALIVLVVLVVVFMNRMGGFTTESIRCENNGGRCIYDAPLGSNPCGHYEVIRAGPEYSCPPLEQDGQPGVCCVGVEI